MASHASRLCCGANADDHTPGPYHLTATLDSSDRLAFPVLRPCGLGLPCYGMACLVFNMVLIDMALPVPVCNSARIVDCRATLHDEPHVRVEYSARHRILTSTHQLPSAITLLLAR